MGWIRMSRKLLGIIGGMGAKASADFYNTIIDHTNAPMDQDHIEILLYSKSSVPDRTTAIESGETQQVVQALQEAYDKLSGAGADYVAMTCNTAHYFINSLRLTEETKLIHIIDETVNYLKDNQIAKIGLLATDGTLQSRIYEDQLLKNGIEVIHSSSENQKLLMNLIYGQIKAGKKPDENMFQSIASELIDKKAEAIILGCTELSVYANLKQLDKFYVDPQKILAKKCIILCGGTLKEESHE